MGECPSLRGAETEWSWKENKDTLKRWRGVHAWKTLGKIGLTSIFFGINVNCVHLVCIIKIKFNIYLCSWIFYCPTFQVHLFCCVKRYTNKFEHTNSPFKVAWVYRKKLWKWYQDFKLQIIVSSDWPFTHNWNIPLDPTCAEPGGVHSLNWPSRLKVEFTSQRYKTGVMDHKGDSQMGRVIVGSLK